MSVSREEGGRGIERTDCGVMTLLDASGAAFKRFTKFRKDSLRLGSHCCLRTRFVTKASHPINRSKSMWSSCEALGRCPDCGGSITSLVCSYNIVSHHSADDCVMVAHLTPDSFEGQPCRLYSDYLPSLRFWCLPSSYVHRE